MRSSPREANRPPGTEAFANILWGPKIHYGPYPEPN
jgi:hypothetical protein